MIETLFVVDVETGCLFIVEWAARPELSSRLGDLHRVADERGQQGSRTQFVKPLRG